MQMQHIMFHVWASFIFHIGNPAPQVYNMSRLTSQRRRENLLIDDSIVRLAGTNNNNRVQPFSSEGSRRLVRHNNIQSPLQKRKILLEFTLYSYVVI